ncbi:hypothetical protein SLE2022_056760 [Rubroshorea leprosula]
MNYVFLANIVSGEPLDLCLRDSQILHDLEGLVFELKEKQLQWEKSWTFLEVPVHKKVLLLEVHPPDSPYEWVLGCNTESS